MNKGAINRVSVNGGAVPNWIVRAVVVAVAAASATVDITTQYASAYGDAVAYVSLTANETIAGRATGAANATVATANGVAYKIASCSANAGAIGSAILTRPVYPQNVNVGTFNSACLNGPVYVSWFQRANAFAGGSVQSASIANRVKSASAYGDAVVVVSLSGIKQVPGRATNAATVSTFTRPSVIFSGVISANAGATGSAAVRNDKFAQASADCTATAYVLVAQALAEANATMGAITQSCVGHIVFFAKSNVIAQADQATATGDVTRYTPVYGAATSSYARGEASTQASGETYFDHDGYVLNARATCTVTIPADRVKIIATFGSFEFSDCAGDAIPFIRYTTRSIGLSTLTATPIVGKITQYGVVNTTSDATVTAIGTRNVFAQAASTAASSHLSIPSNYRYAGNATGTATNNTVIVTAKRTVYADSQVQASAENTNNITTGGQYRATSLSFSAVTSNAPDAIIKHMVDATANAASASIAANSEVSRKARSTANATAFVVIANGNTNAEVSAPEQRYMVIEAQIRNMTVPFEDRIMTVSA